MLLKMRGGSATATGSAPTARGKQSNKASNPRPSAKEINEMGVGLALIFAAFFALVLADMAVAL